MEDVNFIYEAYELQKRLYESRLERLERQLETERELHKMQLELKQIEDELNKDKLIFTTCEN